MPSPFLSLPLFPSSPRSLAPSSPSQLLFFCLENFNITIRCVDFMRETRTPSTGGMSGGGGRINSEDIEKLEQTALAAITEYQTTGAISCTQCASVTDQSLRNSGDFAGPVYGACCLRYDVRTLTVLHLVV